MMMAAASKATAVNTLVSVLLTLVRHAMILWMRDLACQVLK